MRLDTNQPKAHVSVGAFKNTRQFTIDDSSKAFRLLTDNLYGNKVHSVVREICANALDGHYKKGNDDQPFYVTAPTEYNPFFEVRDYGTGMTYDEMQNVYPVLMKSTKEDTNNENGVFGLGCKIPLTVCDMFLVTSYHPTGNTEAVCFLHEGQPYLGVRDVTTEQVESGVHIKIPVQTDMIEQFREAIAHELQFCRNARIKWSENTDFKKWYCDELISIDLGPIKKVADRKTTSQLEQQYDDSPGFGSAYNNRTIVMGGIGRYKAPGGKMGNRFPQGFVVECDVGAFDVTLSREMVDDTPRTRQFFDQLPNYAFDCIKQFMAEHQHKPQTERISLVREIALLIEWIKINGDDKQSVNNVICQFLFPNADPQRIKISACDFQFEFLVNATPTAQPIRFVLTYGTDSVVAMPIIQLENIICGNPSHNRPRPIIIHNDRTPKREILNYLCADTDSTELDVVFVNDVENVDAIFHFLNTVFEDNLVDLSSNYKFLKEARTKTDQHAFDKKRLVNNVGFSSNKKEFVCVENDNSAIPDIEHGGVYIVQRNRNYYCSQQATEDMYACLTTSRVFSRVNTQNLNVVENVLWYMFGISNIRVFTTTQYHKLVDQGRIGQSSLINDQNIDRGNWYSLQEVMQYLVNHHYPIDCNWNDFVELNNLTNNPVTMFNTCLYDRYASFDTNYKGSILFGMFGVPRINKISPNSLYPHPYDILDPKCMELYHTLEQIDTQVFPKWKPLIDHIQTLAAKRLIAYNIGICLKEFCNVRWIARDQRLIDNQLQTQIDQVSDCDVAQLIGQLNVFVNKHHHRERDKKRK